MKIEKTSKSGSVGKSKKTSKTSSADGSFGKLLKTGGVEGAQAASSASMVSSVDMLLAVQASEDPTQKAAKTRMKNRANIILDQLERIKVNILTGELKTEQMLRLADMISSHREKITDPALTSILDEIDLRAQVEIAKMKKALDSTVD